MRQETVSPGKAHPLVHFLLGPIERLYEETFADIPCDDLSRDDFNDLLKHAVACGDITTVLQLLNSGPAFQLDVTHLLTISSSQLDRESHNLYLWRFAYRQQLDADIIVVDCARVYQALMEYNHLELPVLNTLLRNAVKTSNFELLKVLLDHKASPNFRQPNENSVSLIMEQEHDLKANQPSKELILQTLLRHPDFKTTPADLWHAVYSNLAIDFIHLMAQKADQSYSSFEHDYKSILTVAIDNRRSETAKILTVQTLLESKPLADSINHSDRLGYTALGTLLHRISLLAPKDRNLITLLLKHGANPNSRVAGQYTCFQYAIDHHYTLLDAAFSMLAYGADPKLKSANGETALQILVSKMMMAMDEFIDEEFLKPHFGLLKKLLEAEGKQDIFESLQNAFQQQNILKFIKDFAALQNQLKPSNIEQKVLQKILFYGNKETIPAMLKEMKWEVAQNNNPKTIQELLNFVLNKFAPDGLDYLLSQFRDFIPIAKLQEILQKFSNDLVPLPYTVLRLIALCERVLDELKKDPKAYVQGLGHTLQIAAKAKNLAWVQSLVKRCQVAPGCTKEMTSYNLLQAFTNACVFGDEQTIYYLLDCAIDQNLGPSLSNHALTVLMSKTSQEHIVKLLKKFPKLKDTDSSSSFSLLHTAIGRNLPMIVECLLDSKPEEVKCMLESKATGMSPLHTAISQGNPAMVQLLVNIYQRHRVSLQIRDSSQYSPLDLSVSKPFPYRKIEVTTLLLQQLDKFEDQESDSVSLFYDRIYIRGWEANQPWLPFLHTLIQRHQLDIFKCTKLFVWQPSYLESILLPLQAHFACAQENLEVLKKELHNYFPLALIYLIANYTLRVPVELRTQTTLCIWQKRNAHKLTTKLTISGEAAHAPVPSPLGSL